MARAGHRLLDPSSLTLSYDLMDSGVAQSCLQACAALSLSGNTLSIATALETDLEPFSKLRKYELRNVSSPIFIVMSTSPLS